VQLLFVPGGGMVIDTPGMRGIEIWVEGGGLEAAFGDFGELAEGCQFRDCTHRAEPGCAVRAAVEAGAVAVERLAGYHRQLEELQKLAARRAASARAAQRGRSASARRRGPKRQRDPVLEDEDEEADEREHGDRD
jgi:ribosome biogenesis GTPase